MAITFPTTLDALTNPTGTDRVDIVSHSSQHGNVNDAVEALEAKIGIDSSGVSNSIDYWLKHSSGTWRTEHNADGTHGAITADSLSMGTTALIKADNVSGSKTFQFPNVEGNITVDVLAIAYAISLG